ncbi:MAG: sugar phosphate isomerase/epimerase family protein [Verrucomicrobiota bacterium]
MKSGLCSISFRKHSVDEVIELAKSAGIEGIEWGGDVHVPPGDLELARRVREKTEAAGLEVCSYGSYYKCTDETEPFADVLDSARELGAPVIRLWAGAKGSAEATEDDRRDIAERLRRAVLSAAESNITVALEYHGGTLTDTQESAHRLLQEVGLPDLKLYWQPRTGGEFKDDIPELEAALPVLAHVHCFHWGPGGWKDRRPLLEGTDDWKTYLEIIRQAEDERFIILEFIKDDSPEQLREDARVLRALLAEPARPRER